MVYRIIGLMSGSSLDGLDIVYAQIEEQRGKWSYQIEHAACIPYSNEWTADLKYATGKTVPEFLKLHTAYGRYLGENINNFITLHQLEHRVHFIASHGHTVYHDPVNYTSFQLGDGATIAALTKLPVIADLRSLDVALGGQGAPIVPMGDKLLFSGYDYLLNIGGICNITMYDNDELVAFDICPANQALNALAAREDKHMDAGGTMAAGGRLLADVLGQMNDGDYYKQPPPKSLSNDAAMRLAFPAMMESGHNTNDMLHTVVQHIADQVRLAVAQHPHQKETASMLITGGGAFNTFLVNKITEALNSLNVTVMVPDENTVKYKEALVMGLLGVLRWMEQNTTVSTVTGAYRNSIGGALWMGEEV